LALALVILLPFGVGIAPLPYRWSLFERLAYSMNYFKYIVMGAFNVWAILLSSMPDFTLDNGKWLFGLTFETLGAIASAVIYCIIMLIYWTKRDSKALIWSCLAISLTLFMVPTRMHERYLFVGVVFAELIAVIFPRLWWCYGLLTLTYLSNLYWVYNYYYPTMRLDWLYSSAVFVHLIAVINLGLFLYVLVGMGGVVGGGGIDQKRAARALRAKWGRRRLVAAG